MQAVWQGEHWEVLSKQNQLKPNCRILCCSSAGFISCSSESRKIRDSVVPVLFCFTTTSISGNEFGISLARHAGCGKWNDERQLRLLIFLNCVWMFKVWRASWQLNRKRKRERTQKLRSSEKIEFDAVSSTNPAGQALVVSWQDSTICGAFKFSSFDWNRIAAGVCQQRIVCIVQRTI